MKDRPILFSAPMVRAIFDGSKTQTRRIVKDRGHEVENAEYGVAYQTCPYGKPGDRLWVRETHRPIFGQTCGLIAVDYQADPREKWERLGDQIGAPTKWTPSIHMRREYSRILLEIVSVCVERLQDISEADAIAEGLIPDIGEPGDECGFWKSPADGRVQYTWAPDAYRELWEQINGAGSWDANPWVWVVKFKKAQDGHPRA